MYARIIRSKYIKIVMRRLMHAQLFRIIDLKQAHNEHELDWLKFLNKAHFRYPLCEFPQISQGYTVVSNH